MMDVFKRFNIGYVFFTCFSILFFLLIIIIISITYYMTETDSVNKTLKHKEEKLKLLSEGLNNELLNYEKTSIVMERQDVFIKLINNRYRKDNNILEYRETVSSLNSNFSNIVYSIPGLQSVSIYMKSPPSIQWGPVEFQSISIIEKNEWYKNFNGTSSAWLGEREVLINSSKEKVVSYGKKVFSAKGDLVAVLVLNVSSAYIQEWITERSDTDNLAIFDGKSSISFHSSLLSRNNLRSIKENILYFKQKENIYIDFIYQNGDLIVSTLVPTSEWIISEIISKKTLTESGRTIAQLLILIGIIAIIIAFFVIFYLTRKFTYPINYLSKVLKNHRIKELPEKLPDDYRNEFGQLFQSYRQLIYRSENLYRSLIQANRWQRETEIKALQANINPHFLYNTLDQLNWRAIERGDHDLSKMMELLGKMLRIGLSNGESIITVEREIDYLHHYLELQKIRMESNLSYEIKRTDNANDCYIPKLTLQPFVENSIIHGFIDQKDCIINIKIKEFKSTIKFEIEDNGNGIDKDYISSINSSQDTGGYGIKNVRNRLFAYFGDSAKIQLLNNKLTGTTVIITIPKISDKDYFSNNNLEHWILSEGE